MNTTDLQEARDVQLGRNLRLLFAKTSFTMIRAAGGQAVIRAIGQDELRPYVVNDVLDDAILAALNQESEK